MSEFDKMVKEANSQVKERKTSEEPRHYIVFDKTEVEIDGQKKSLMDFYKSDIEPITRSAKAQAVLFLKLIRIHKATETGPKSTREKTSK